MSTLGRGAASATHVAAYLVVRGMIVIQRRSELREFLPGAWDVIGGRINADESPKDALRREVLEETGLALSAIGPWITRAEFEQDGKPCLEIGALVWSYSELMELESGKASAFALVRDPRPFIDDNAARGYGRHLERPLTEAIRAADSWDTEWSKSRS